LFFSSFRSSYFNNLHLFRRGDAIAPWETFLLFQGEPVELIQRQPDHQQPAITLYLCLAEDSLCLPDIAITSLLSARNRLPLHSLGLAGKKPSRPATNRYVCSFRFDGAVPGLRPGATGKSD